MIDFTTQLEKLFNKEPHLVNRYLDYITQHGTKTRPTNCYAEKHHILPRKLFPEFKNYTENLIYLSAYDHFVAHYILAFSRNKDTLFALNNMNRLKTINVRRKDIIISEEQLKEMALLYENFRKDLSITMRELNSGRKHTQETKKKQSERQTNTYKVTHRITGEKLTISCEEYKNNKHLYKSNNEGRIQSKETKDKMSKNGIKGKKAYTHKVTGDIVYSDIEMERNEWDIGVPSQKNIMKNKFLNNYFWTNTKTGECIRSKIQPGEDWIRKRTGHKNFYEGKMNSINLLTGIKEFVDISNKSEYNIAHNSLIYIYKNFISLDYTPFPKLLGIPDIPYQTLITIIKNNNLYPHKRATRKTIKNFNEETKLKYSYIIGMTFHEIYELFKLEEIKSIAAIDYIYKETDIFLFARTPACNF